MYIAIVYFVNIIFIVIDIICEILINCMKMYFWFFFLKVNLSVFVLFTAEIERFTFSDIVLYAGSHQHAAAERLEYLLRAGADPNQLILIYRYRVGTQYVTPLHCLAKTARFRRGDLHFATCAIDLLAKNRIDVHANNNPLNGVLKSALVELIENSEREYKYRVFIAAKLLSIGVDVSTETCDMYRKNFFNAMIISTSTNAFEFFFDAGYHFGNENGFDKEKKCVTWKKFNPLSLCRLAANVVRMSLYPNALVGVKGLILPPGWIGCREYITMDTMRLKMRDVSDPYLVVRF